MPDGSSSVPEGRSDRSLARSAWNSPAPEERPVGHGMIGADLIPEVFRVERCAVFLKANHSNHRIRAHTGANQVVPYGTALLGWRCSRHFVPGYDRTVPLGLSPFGATNRLKHSLT
jgi:hypothetical protein